MFVGLIFALLVFTGLYKKSKTIVTDNNNYDKSDELMVLWFLSILITLAISLVGSSAILHILNPEYYAIKEILNSIK